MSAITTWYPGGHEVLSSVAFTVNAGETVFVTGRTGADCDFVPGAWRPEA